MAQRSLCKDVLIIVTHGGSSPRGSRASSTAKWSVIDSDFAAIYCYHFLDQTPHLRSHMAPSFGSVVIMLREVLNNKQICRVVIGYGYQATRLVAVVSVLIIPDLA